MVGHKRSLRRSFLLNHNVSIGVIKTLEQMFRGCTRAHAKERCHKILLDQHGMIVVGKIVAEYIRTHNRITNIVGVSPMSNLMVAAASIMCTDAGIATQPIYVSGNRVLPDTEVMKPNLRLCILYPYMLTGNNVVDIIENLSGIDLTVTNVVSIIDAYGNGARHIQDRFSVDVFSMVSI